MIRKDEIFQHRQVFIKAFKNKDFLKANLFGEKLINLYNDKSEIDNYEYCVDLYNLAFLNQKLGNLCKALNFHGKNIKFFENQDFFKKNNYTEKEAKLFTDVFISNGICHSKKGDFKLAIESFERALQISSKFLKGEIEYLNSSHNLGCAYFDIKDYDKSLYFHLETLKHRKTKDIDYADNLNYIGYCYEAKEDYNNSISYLKKALPIIKGLYGINSSEHISNLYYIANVYEKAEEYKNSIRFYKKVCYFMEQLNKKSIYFIECIDKISTLHFKLEEVDKSIEVSQKALKLARNFFGENHIFYASKLKKLADIYLFNKEYEKALDNYEKEIKIKEKVVGKDSYMYVESLIDLIDINSKLNNTESIDNLCNEVFGFISRNIDNQMNRKIFLLLVQILKNNNQETCIKTIYEKFKSFGNGLSYEDMLKEAENIKQDLSFFENVSTFSENNNKFLKSNLQEEILKNIKNILESNLTSYENLKIEEKKDKKETKSNKKEDKEDIVLENYTQESILDLLLTENDDNNEPENLI